MGRGWGSGAKEEAFRKFPEVCGGTVRLASLDLQMTDRALDTWLDNDERWLWVVLCGGPFGFPVCT